MATDGLLDAIADAIVHRVIAHLHPVVVRASSALAKVQPVLLTVKDAALYLGRSEQSMQHLIFRRELPVVRVGRRVHLHKEDLDRWIERNKV